jgi:hypothetical protein
VALQNSWVTPQHVPFTQSSVAPQQSLGCEQAPPTGTQQVACAPPTERHVSPEQHDPALAHTAPSFPSVQAVAVSVLASDPLVPAVPVVPPRPAVPVVPACPVAPPRPALPVVPAVPVVPPRPALPVVEPEPPQAPASACKISRAAAHPAPVPRDRRM